MTEKLSTIEPFTVGVISDTHGLLRPNALQALEGSDLIIHAGDVGNPEILDSLRSLAPLIAVRGNVDHGEWAHLLPQTQIAEVGEVLIYVLHDRHELDLDPAAAGFNAVISGHSHMPSIEQRNGVLYLNPGSAGPRRFSKPVSLAQITVQNGSISARIIPLDW
jgi:putative phosphoesterase